MKCYDLHIAKYVAVIEINALTFLPTIKNVRINLKMIGTFKSSSSAETSSLHTVNQIDQSSKKDYSFQTSDIIQNSSISEETDHISQRRCRLQQGLIVSLREDLSEWINKTLGPTNINADNFIQALDNGVILCQLSLVIEKRAKEYAQMGKYTAPLPSYKMHCNKNAKSGTWLARDNTTNFLKWCRAYGLKDENLFDSEDLVIHHKEMQVIYCLMELARLGARFGLEPPTLITLEQEIDSDSTVANIPPLPSHSPESAITLSRVDSMEKADIMPTDTDPEVQPSLDSEVSKIAAKYQRSKHVKKLSKGLYLVFGKQVFIRLLKGKHLMVRVGGGWDTFENYLVHHDSAPPTELKQDGSLCNTQQRAGRSSSRQSHPEHRSSSLSGHNTSGRRSHEIHKPSFFTTTPQSM
ncbi:GAS2-like protein 3 [Bulinus truncatus]|nr:GAS2-like protein 3 [Bulinus truncatus]